MHNISKSSVRALVRASVVAATAFGLGLSAEQVAAIQLLAEATLQMFFKDE